MEQVHSRVDEAHFALGEGGVVPAYRRGSVEQPPRVPIAMLQKCRQQHAGRYGHLVLLVDRDFGEDQRRQREIQVCGTLGRVAPVDDHWSPRDQHDVVRVQVEMQDPVGVIGTQPRRKRVEPTVQIGEESTARLDVEIAGRQGLGHGRPVEPLHHEIGASCLVDPGSGKPEPSHVDHDRRLGRDVAAVTVATQNLMRIDHEDVGVTPRCQQDWLCHPATIAIAEVAFVFGRRRSADYCGDVSDAAGDRLFADPELDWQSVSPALVTERRLPVAVLALLGLGLVVGGVVAMVADSGAAWPLALPGLVIIALAALLWWVAVPRVVAAWRYAEREQDLLVSRGRLQRRLSVVPYGRMQVIEVSANPVSRRLGIATVTLVTASAATDARIPGLPTDVAQRLRDRLASKGEAAAAGL